MSTGHEQSQSSGFSTMDLDQFKDWFHIPALVAVIFFMFWTRMQSYGNFVREDGIISLAAIDSWYHWRTTMYTVQNWPFTMPFDPWTAYPQGRYVGQFGTLFDQIVATVALIIGLGSPTEAQVLQAALITVPALAALVAIPTFYIGKRLGGRVGGLAGVVLLALFPGTFFFRTTTGQLQHHVGEVLFMAIAVLAMMVAIDTAEREKPVWELFVDRDWVGLRKPIVYSALAGFAIGLYLWIWPPAVFFVGILGFFFLIKLTWDYLLGVSPDHVALVGAVSLTIPGLMMLAKIEVLTTGVTSFGILQPFLALSVAGGCVFMAWLARQWDARRIDPMYYPLVLSGGITGGLLLLWVLAPGLFETLTDNFIRRMTPLGQHVTDQTIAEARPPADISQHVFEEYGLAFYTMVVGVIILAARPIVVGEQRGDHLLIVIWSIFLISMAFTQVRFNYYLVLSIAVINAYLVGWVVRWADFPEGLESIRDIDGYQVMTILTVLMILVVPLMPPVAGATVVDRGAVMGPGGDSVKWEGSNLWLAENSPPVGAWGGADNEDAIELYGTFPVPQDGDFRYPEGSYGVISWWDYGHLITVQAERIPHSNPFQANALSSSAFLLADSEERAELLLDAMPSGERIYDASNEELEGIVADLDDEQRDEHIRYVMIDDSMAGGKFSAISTWTASFGDFVETQNYEVGDDDQITVPGLSDAYDETMLARLYYDDAARLQHYRLVHETPQQSTFVSVAARQEGRDWQPIRINREVDFGLQQELQQLVQTPQIEVEIYEQRQGARVKTFERVEGATITGTVDEVTENTTVVATVQMNATTSDRTFTYLQEATPAANGTFELTVPYATTNDLGPEDGYTNSSVLAEDDYMIFVSDRPELVLLGLDAPSELANVTVEERAIYEGDRVEVELETIEAPDPDENGVTIETDDEEPDPTEENDETEEAEEPEDLDENGNEEPIEGDDETEENDEVANDGEGDGESSTDGNETA